MRSRRPSFGVAEPLVKRTESGQECVVHRVDDERPQN